MINLRDMRLTEKGRGACAFIHRQQLSDNSHPVLTTDYTLWREGWLWAQREGMRQDDVNDRDDGS